MNLFRREKASHPVLYGRSLSLPITSSSKDAADGPSGYRWYSRSKRKTFGQSYLKSAVKENGMSQSMSRFNSGRNSKEQPQGFLAVHQNYRPSSTFSDFIRINQDNIHLHESKSQSRNGASNKKLKKVTFKWSRSEPEGIVSWRSHGLHSALERTRSLEQEHHGASNRGFFASFSKGLSQILSSSSKDIRVTGKEDEDPIRRFKLRKDPLSRRPPGPKHSE